MRKFEDETSAVLNVIFDNEINPFDCWYTVSLADEATIPFINQIIFDAGFDNLKLTLSCAKNIQEISNLNNFSIFYTIQFST